MSTRMKAPSMIGAAASWGLYFPIYNGITDNLKEYRNNEVPAYQYFFSGCLAGSAVLTLTNPIWVTKTQQCLQERVFRLKFSVSSWNLDIQ